MFNGIIIKVSWVIMISPYKHNPVIRLRKAFTITIIHILVIARSFSFFCRPVESEVRAGGFFIISGADTAQRTAGGGDRQKGKHPKPGEPPTVQPAPTSRQKRKSKKIF